MADIAIEFHDVSKKFRKGEASDSLRDLIPAMCKKLLKRGRRIAEELVDKEFWALREVSFQVKEGDTLGIIGPNGAGKSTILKILSGIIRPTVGHYRVNGRLSALIEIGAGFHQDLTGKENIFLNGAILGMRRSEINAKFDEIVEFSGLKEFIDTPVKRYSSGMYARLGFSVAVHVDPDILLVDEVLSVGDMAFQAKCQRKMHEIAGSGTTIIFITHNMNAIADLCPETIVLSGGKVTYQGPTQEAIKFYFQAAHISPQDHKDDGLLYLERKTIKSSNGEVRKIFRSGESFKLECVFQALEVLSNLGIAIWVRNLNGDQVFNISSQRMNVPTVSVNRGQRFGCSFTLVANLCAGSYTIGVLVRRYDLDLTYLLIEPLERIEVVDSDNCGGTAWLSPSCSLALGDNVG